MDYLVARAKIIVPGDFIKAELVSFVALSNHIMTIRWVFESPDEIHDNRRLIITGLITSVKRPRENRRRDWADWKVNMTLLVHKAEQVSKFNSYAPSPGETICCRFKHDASLLRASV